MSNWLQKIFRRKVGVKTLNPGVKFLLSHCVLGVVAGFAAGNGVFVCVPDQVVYSINSVVDVRPVNFGFTVFLGKGRNTTVDAIGRREITELLLCEPKFQFSQRSAIYVSKPQGVKGGFTVPFSLGFSSYTGGFSLETPATSGFPVCDNFISAVAFEPEQPPSGTTANRVSRITLNFFDESKTAKFVSRLSFNCLHVIKEQNITLNGTIT